MDKKELTAIFLTISTIIGISILALPYIFQNIGLGTGMISMLLIGSAALLMTLYIAELDLSTKDYHISGFAKKFLGKNGQLAVLAIEVIGLYAILTSYLIIAGEGLSWLFGGSEIVWGTLAFLALTPFIIYGKERYDKEGVAISILKLFVLLLVIAIMLPNANISKMAEVSGEKVLLPFGLLLFAFLGYTTIPIVNEYVKKKNIRKNILTSYLIVFTIYFLFSLALSGSKVLNETSLLGLEKVSTLGAIYIILAVSLPFIAISNAIKQIYTNHIKLRKKAAWILTALIPYILYVYSNWTYVDWLQFAGTYMGGTLGILTGIMALKLRKAKRKVILVPGGEIPIIYMLAVFISGMIYQTILYFL